MVSATKESQTKLVSYGQLVRIEDAETAHTVTVTHGLCVIVITDTLVITELRSTQKSAVTLALQLSYTKIDRVADSKLNLERKGKG